MQEIKERGSSYWIIKSFNDPTYTTPEEAIEITNTVILDFMNAGYMARLITAPYTSNAGRLGYKYQVDVSIYN